MAKQLVDSQSSSCTVSAYAHTVADKAKVAKGLEEREGELLAQARYIVQHGWVPAFFMIDKCAAAKEAIERGLSAPSIKDSGRSSLPSFSWSLHPHLPVPCDAGWSVYFHRHRNNHYIQAILRWHRDGGADGDRQPRPALSLARKHHLLAAVRELQRCRDPGRWDQCTALFRRRLDDLMRGAQGTTANDIYRYFEVNWFCPQWRGACLTKKKISSSSTDVCCR
ncbi:hypothetical protein FB45DRAFT_324028 [Roridomyces roridus]|uniref:Uncharacterized protein n=1 Tax=Roridomyces roridus TaxID=1738132 RepID=A0AAD7F5A9_9AGAR|nr:hypothetical protein FB45DRAFT_324028 [Roridomyces roridus]